MTTTRRSSDRRRWVTLGLSHIPSKRRGTLVTSRECTMRLKGFCADRTLKRGKVKVLDVIYGCNTNYTKRRKSTSSGYIFPKIIWEAQSMSKMTLLSKIDRFLPNRPFPAKSDHFLPNRPFPAKSGHFLPNRPDPARPSQIDQIWPDPAKSDLARLCQI